MTQHIKNLAVVAADIVAVSTILLWLMLRLFGDDDDEDWD